MTEPVFREVLAEAFRQSGMSIAWDSDALPSVCNRIIAALADEWNPDKLREALLLTNEALIGNGLLPFTVEANRQALATPVEKVVLREGMAGHGSHRPGSVCLECEKVVEP